MNFAIHSPFFLGISSALQQHAPIEKNFVRNFEPKNILKTEWFDS